MNLFVISQMKLIQSLYKSDDYLDVLLTVADFLDLVNLFAFPGWEDAELVDADFLKYFTHITLKTDMDKMPHPKGALLLTKLGCQVKYHETKEAFLKPLQSLDDTYYDWKDDKRKRKVVKKKCWEVEVLIPNRYLFPNNGLTIEELQNKALEAKAENDEIYNDNPEQPTIEDLEDNAAQQGENQNNPMNGPAPGAVPTNPQGGM